MLQDVTVEPEDYKTWFTTLVLAAVGETLPHSHLFVSGNPTTSLVFSRSVCFGQLGLAVIGRGKGCMISVCFSNLDEDQKRTIETHIISLLKISPSLIKLQPLPPGQLILSWSYLLPSCPHMSRLAASPLPLDHNPAWTINRWLFWRCVLSVCLVYSYRRAQSQLGPVSVLGK